MERENQLRIIDVNLLYLIGALLFFTLGFYVQTRELYTGLLITQFAVVLLPAVVYLEIKKLDIKNTIRMNPLNWKQIVLTVLITLFMYPSAVFANLIMINLLSQLGTIDVPQIPVATNIYEYLRLVLIVSLAAGICEEVLFRGVILRGYERLGNVKAVMITSVLFGIFHYNLYNLLGPIVLGIIFGSLVLVTQSLWAGIIGHIVNNLLAVSIGYFYYLIDDYIPIQETEITEIALQDSLFASMIFFGVLTIAGLFLSIILWKKLKRISQDFRDSEVSGTEPEHDENSPKNLTERKNRVSLMEYIPLSGAIPLFIYVAIWQIGNILSNS